MVRKVKEVAKMKLLLFSSLYKSYEDNKNGYGILTPDNQRICLLGLQINDCVFGLIIDYKWKVEDDA